MSFRGDLFDSLFSDSEKQYLDTANEFAVKYLTEPNITTWCAQGGIPLDILEAYKESGLGFVGLKPEWGGPEASPLAQALIVEELSRVAGTTLPMQTQMNTWITLSKFATKEQAQPFIDQYAERGVSLLSMAFTDASGGSDLKGYQTHVETRNGKRYINGTKSFVSNGRFVSYFVVLAKDMNYAEEMVNAPISLWLIPSNIPGIKFHSMNLLGQKLVSMTAVSFEDVEVQPEWRIGEPILSQQESHQVFRRTRCLVSAASLGMAQGALEDAAHYANYRFLKNNPIAKLQQIAVKLSDMQTSLYNMRFLVYNAAMELDKEDEKAAFSNAMMKKFVPAEATKVANDGMQILGGVGYTDSSRIGRIWLDCRGNQFAASTDEVMNILLAKEISKRYK